MEMLELWSNVDVGGINKQKQVSEMVNHRLEDPCSLREAPPSKGRSKGHAHPMKEADGSHVF